MEACMSWSVAFLCTFTVLYSIYLSPRYKPNLHLQTWTWPWFVHKTARHRRLITVSRSQLKKKKKKKKKGAQTRWPAPGKQSANAVVQVTWKVPQSREQRSA